MITEPIEAFSLEEGDQILIGDNVYKIVLLISDDETYAIKVVDEEGDVYQITSNPSKKFQLIVD